MTRRMSLIAVCCSSASRVWLKRRTLSIAMAACRANVCTSATWLGENCTGSRRKRKMPPYAPPSRMSGTDRTARAPSGDDARLRVGILGVEQRHDVRVVNRHAVQRGAAGEGRALERDAPGGCASGSLLERVVGGRLQVFAFDEQHAREGCVAELRGALCHGIEHRLHVGGRARDRVQDVRDRRLLLERLLRLVEEAHVLDPDRRLAGERLDQRDLLGAERSRLVAPQCEHADRTILAHQRDAHDRAEAVFRLRRPGIGVLARRAAARCRHD